MRGLTRFDNTRYSHYQGVRWLVALREICGSIAGSVRGPALTGGQAWLTTHSSSPKRVSITMARSRPRLRSSMLQAPLIVSSGMATLGELETTSGVIAFGRRAVQDFDTSGGVLKKFHVSAGAAGE
jgi:hypothetical protein